MSDMAAVGRVRWFTTEELRGLKGRREKGEGGRPLFLGINDCDRLPDSAVEIHAPAKIDASTCRETVERPSASTSAMTIAAAL